MHGGVRPREVGAPHGPRVARDGMRKNKLLDHDIIRLVDCVPQPPDSVPDVMQLNKSIHFLYQTCPFFKCFRAMTPIHIFL